MARGWDGLGTGEMVMVGRGREVVRGESGRKMVWSRKSEWRRDIIGLRLWRGGYDRLSWMWDEMTVLVEWWYWKG